MRATACVMFIASHVIMQVQMGILPVGNTATLLPTEPTPIP